MSKASKEFAESAGEVDTWHNVKHAPKKEKRPEKPEENNRGKPQNRTPGPRGPRPSGEGRRPGPNNRGPRGPNPNQKNQQQKDQKPEPKKDGPVGGLVKVVGEIKAPHTAQGFSWAEMARKHVVEKPVAAPAPTPAPVPVVAAPVQYVEEPVQEEVHEEPQVEETPAASSWPNAANDWSADNAEDDQPEAETQAEVEEEEEIIEEQEPEPPVHVEVPAPVVEAPVTHAPVAPIAAPVQRSAPTAYRPNLSQKAARAEADAQKKTAPKFVFASPVQLPTGIDEFVDTSYSFAGGAAEEEEPVPQQTPHLVEASTDPPENLLQTEQTQAVQPPAPQPHHVPVPPQAPQAPQAAVRQPVATEDIYSYEEQSLHRPAEQASFFPDASAFHQPPHQPHLHHHHHAHQHRSPQAETGKQNQQGRGFSGKGGNQAQFNNYRGGVPMYAPYYAPYMGMGSEYFDGYDKQPFVQQARGPAYAYGYYAQPPYMGPMAPPWNYANFNAAQQHVPTTAPQFQQQPRRQQNFERNQQGAAAGYQQGGNYFNPAAANYAPGYPQYPQHNTQQPGPN